MAALGLLGLTLISLAILWRWGDWEERLITGVVVGLTLAVPLFEPWKFGSWRIGVAALDMVLLAVSVGLALARDRWWLTALAGFQAITVLTHIAVLILPGNYTWTAITLRWEVWILVCITFLCGAWEASVARRFALGGAES